MPHSLAQERRSNLTTVGLGFTKDMTVMRGEREEQLNTNDKACYFICEEQPMYTGRESELLQQPQERK